MYYVIRNNQQYGPYDIDTLAQYVQQGQLLKCDKAYDANRTSDIRTIGFFLKINHRKVYIPHNGSIISQIKTIGSQLIVPKEIIQKSTWTSDKRLLLLALIGLVPLLLQFIAFSNFFVFYSVSLYFSVVWGLFFYYFFKNSQVKLKTTLLIFFLTQFFVFAIWGFGLNNINVFYFLEKSHGFILRLLFYICAVGITEEFAKAISLLIISSKAKEPLVPQTLVFYGLMSGIAFGVFEGVQYQMGVNAELEYTESFFSNIARLTSLPFLHAVWCGIAGYFISFAKLYPKYRKSLYVLAIGVPALLHGIYDTFCSSFLGMLIAVPVTFIGVVLLMTYLKNGTNYQSKLRN